MENSEIGSSSSEVPVKVDSPDKPSTRTRLWGLRHSAAAAWTVAVILAMTVVGLSVQLANTHSGGFVGPAFRAGGIGPGPRFIGPGALNGPGFKGSQSGQGNQTGQGSPRGTSDLSPFGGAGFGVRARGQGNAGTVTNLHDDTFVLDASSGQHYTVEELSTTAYQNGPNTGSKSAIKNGSRVIVQGSVSANTIKASTITVLPTPTASNATT